MAETKSVAELNDSDLSLIERFREYAREFNATLTTLKDEPVPANAPAALKSERAALIVRGTALKSNIAATTSAVDSAWSSIKSFFGFAGIATQSLGAIQLIPLAVIAAGASAIAYFLNDVANYRARLNAWKATNPAAGALPPAPDSVIDRAGSVAVKVGALALIGFVVWAYFNRSK